MPKGRALSTSWHVDGSRYQTDKDAVQNSLFGDMDMVEIATPGSAAGRTVELVGAFEQGARLGRHLSVRPIRWTIMPSYFKNVCNVHMADLKDLEQFVNMDLTLGGMVTAVRKGHLKTGKPYGIVTMEDFTGAYELALFGRRLAYMGLIYGCGEYALYHSQMPTPAMGSFQTGFPYWAH